MKIIFLNIFIVEHILSESAGIYGNYIQVTVCKLVNVDFWKRFLMRSEPHVFTIFKYNFYLAIFEKVYFYYIRFLIYLTLII